LINFDSGVDQAVSHKLKFNFDLNSAALSRAKARVRSSSDENGSDSMKYWEIIAAKLGNAG
jgi:hypothetical protein